MNRFFIIFVDQTTKHSMKNFFFIKLALVIIAMTFVVPNSFGQKKKKKVAPVKEVVVDTIRIPVFHVSAPVVAFNDTLFRIYGNIGSVSVKKRAKWVEDNIKEIGSDYQFKPDSVKIAIESGTYNIVYKGNTIMGITDQQAEALEQSKDQIAKDYRLKIIKVITKHHQQTGWKYLMRQFFFGIILLLCSYGLVRGINSLVVKLRERLENREISTFKSLNKIIEADKQISFILSVIKVVRLLLILLIVYVSLFLFFRLFPETRWISNSLIGYVRSPILGLWTSFVGFIPNLIYIVVVYFVFRFISKAMMSVAKRVQRGAIRFNGFYPDWAMTTYYIFRGILYIFMFILIFPRLPYADSDIFKGVSVFMGILFSLGSASVISNMVSGIVITYMRSFRLGDRIRMGEHVGHVIEKTPLVTRIRTPKNEMITIPNVNILTAHTVNYTTSAKRFGLILHISITVGYEVSWRLVHQLLLKATVGIPHVKEDPKPFVQQTELDDFYARYQVNVYTDDADEAGDILSKLNENIQDVFNEAGVELASPHYSYQRDAKGPIVPREYLKEGILNVNPFGIKVTKEDLNNDHKKKEK